MRWGYSWRDESDDEAYAGGAGIGLTQISSGDEFVVGEHAAPFGNRGFHSNLFARYSTPSVGHANTIQIVEASDATRFDGWSSNQGTISQSSCGRFGNVLGGYGATAPHVSFTKLIDLSNFRHTAVRIAMNFIQIDSWESEYAFVYADETLVWQRELSGDVGEDVCGNPAAPQWLDQMIPVEVVIPHQRDNITIRVTTSLDQPGTDESFGISAMEISTVVGFTQTPEDAYTCSCASGFANGLCLYSSINQYHNLCRLRHSGDCD
eukprot:SAG11_NODE_3611_length_2341_cov_1.662801_2_plen_263_part_01